MGWLSLEELCIFSRTCKRLQRLSENHFLRKYPYEASRELWIGIKIDGKVWVSPSDYYVKYFYNFVNKLTIYERDNFEERNLKLRDKQLTFSHISNFVKTKCDQNLHKICIVGDLKLTQSFCRGIENFLLNVQIVQFIDRREECQFCQDKATFLRYCPNVAKLILSDSNNMNSVNAMFQQKCHRLTHFYYLDGLVVGLNSEKLGTFFQTNENIQCVAWEFSQYDDGDFAENCVVESIRTLDYAINLQRLFLVTTAPLTKCFGDVCRYLSMLCERENFKSLEIKFVHEEGAKALKSHANALANLKQLTKINLHSIRLTQLIPELRSMIYLKFMFLHWCQYTISDAQNVSLPQIEEVQIAKGDEKLFVMHFVKQCTNLKRILVTGYTKFDIAELNRARASLESACELTIFTNIKENATNLDYKLVKVKLVKLMELHYDACPLTRFRMPSRK